MRVRPEWQRLGINTIRKRFQARELIQRTFFQSFFVIINPHFSFYWMVSARVIRDSRNCTSFSIQLSRQNLQCLVVCSRVSALQISQQTRILDIEWVVTDILYSYAVEAYLNSLVFNSWSWRYIWFWKPQIGLDATSGKTLYGPFAAFHSRGTKPPCWDAKVALGQDQQKAYIILNGNSFVCLVPVRLLRPSMAVLYHVNGKLQRAYYYRLLSNSRKAFLFSYVPGDLEKLVFLVVSQDNENLAFYWGEVFSLVCLLLLTARFKLLLGEGNASFYKTTAALHCRLGQSYLHQKYIL